MNSLKDVTQYLLKLTAVIIIIIIMTINIKEKYRNYGSCTKALAVPEVEEKRKQNALCRISN
jgi:hypothetical protein